MNLQRRVVPLVLLSAAMASCFEPPVAESLRLEFLPEGWVSVTASTRIRDLDAANPQLQRRIEEARRAALEGSDPWSRRFEALGGAIERGRWEKHDGKLVLFERGATTDDPEALARFFADTGVIAAWKRDESRAELVLYPPATGSATRQERQRVSRALAGWSEAIRTYLERAAELWVYLDEHPDRDRACLTRVFSAYLTEEVTAAADEPTTGEQALLDRLDEAMRAVTAVLTVGEGEAYSLDEISRHVYDPFPAPIEVVVPDSVLEIEGFRRETGDPKRLHAGGTSLWQALRALDGRWLSPDPLLSLVEHDLRANPQQPFDLDAFLARRRRVAEPPSTGDVRAAIASGLEARAEYRVAWRESVPEGAGDH